MIINIPIISEINQVISPYFAFVFLFLLAVAIIFFSLYISAKKKINMLKNTDLTIKYHIIKQEESKKPNNSKNSVKNIEPTKTKDEVLDKERVKPLPSYALTPDPLKNISNLIDPQIADSEELVKKDLSKETIPLPASLGSNNESPSKIGNFVKSKEPSVNIDGTKTPSVNLVNKEVDSLAGYEKSNDSGSNIKKESTKNESISIPSDSNKKIEDSKAKNSIKVDNKSISNTYYNPLNNEIDSSLISDNSNKGKEQDDKDSTFENALVSEENSRKVDTKENNNIDKLAQINALKKELENALETHEPHISNITPELNTDQSTIKKIPPTLDHDKNINVAEHDNKDNIKVITNTDIDNKSSNIPDSIIKSEDSSKPTDLTESTDYKDSVKLIQKKDSSIINPSTTDLNSHIVNTKNVSVKTSVDTSKSLNNKINDGSKDNVNKKTDEKHQRKSKKGKSSGV
jgi:hypothetical protein